MAKRLHWKEGCYKIEVIITCIRLIALDDKQYRTEWHPPGIAVHIECNKISMAELQLSIYVCPTRTGTCTHTYTFLWQCLNLGLVYAGCVFLMRLYVSAIGLCGTSIKASWNWAIVEHQRRKEQRAKQSRMKQRRFVNTFETAQRNLVLSIVAAMWSNFLVDIRKWSYERDVQGPSKYFASLASFARKHATSAEPWLYAHSCMPFANFASVLFEIGEGISVIDPIGTKEIKHRPI